MSGQGAGFGSGEIRVGIRVRFGGIRLGGLAAGVSRARCRKQGDSQRHRLRNFDCRLDGGEGWDLAWITRSGVAGVGEGGGTAGVAGVAGVGMGGGSGGWRCRTVVAVDGDGQRKEDGGAEGGGPGSHLVARESLGFASGLLPG